MASYFLFPMGRHALADYMNIGWQRMVRESIGDDYCILSSKNGSLEWRGSKFLWCTEGVLQQLPFDKATNRVGAWNETMVGKKGRRQIHEGNDQEETLNRLWHPNNPSMVCVMRDMVDGSTESLNFMSTLFRNILYILYVYAGDTSFLWSQHLCSLSVWFLLGKSEPVDSNSIQNHVL